MTFKSKKLIYLADLAYFNQYSLSILTIPLNIAYIASYTLKLFKNEVEIVLFKDPRKLLLASKIHPPDVLGLSCYYWNMNLDVLVASRIKKINPECITVIGGPSVDTDIREQLDLYSLFNGNLDFMVLNEGELGFSKIIERIISKSINKLFHDALMGCIFCIERDKLIEGRSIGLSLDLETLPSPILDGIIDDFLTPEFMPIIQCSRMCPYSCSYCCSGKLKGKLRKFSDTVVKAEIEYIAKKYRDNPHRILFISDENFGINKRDSLIAEFLVNSKKKFGYPQQTFCYFDKKLSSTVKKSSLLFADMNAGGLQLAFQSFNEDSLRAVKRRNISNEEIKEAVIWARMNGIKTFSELIFGLPYETKQSFLDSLEFVMQAKVDTIAAHNLFLMKGIELNRKQERNKFKLSTKYRPSYASAYDIIENKFVCESEEIVISSSHFSFDDFMDIRKISLMFYAINSLEYFKLVFNYLVDNKFKVIPLLDSIMNPSEKQHNSEYLTFVNDFINTSSSELFDTHEDVCSHLRDQFIKNDNKVIAPTRLNVYFSSRLIYKEGWFSKVIRQFVKPELMDNYMSRIFIDLITLSENEWIDIKHPELNKTVLVSEDTLAYLNIPAPKKKASKYHLKLTSSERQLKNIEGYNKQYSLEDEDDSYYYNVMDIIQPRKQLRYECIEVQNFV